MIPTFFCSLAGGMLAVLAISRIDPIACRFVRLVGLIAFTASVGIGVWSAIEDRMTGVAGAAAGGLSLLCAAAAAAVILLSPIMEQKNSGLRIAAAVGAVGGISASCIWSFIFMDGESGGWLLNLLGRALASFLLGSVTVAWLLGHLYLTARGLPINVLERVSRLFSWAVGLRWVYFVVCMGIIYFGSTGDAGVSFSYQMSSLWLILSLRIAVGLFSTAVFAYFVADCVKCKSTQSATGILYFASVFVYIGELSSQHLANEVGLPF